jgi:hypothetical protein
MEIALFTPDSTYLDENLVFEKLDFYKVTKIHVATTMTFQIASNYGAYIGEHIEIIRHNLKSEGKEKRLKKAIDLAPTCIFFYNGNAPTPKNKHDGYRTSIALEYALMKEKDINVFPYKTSAFEITKKENGFVEINFFNRLCDINRIKSVNLNKEQLEKLISQLQAAL